SGVPFLSEAILSQPCEDQNLHLPPGIHLHWTMPDALAHGASDGKRVKFHRVPNRWLIRRSPGPLPERKWIVESDFLSRGLVPGQHPECATTYPYPEDARQPYRYIGRCRSLEEWLKGESHPSEYLDT